MHNLTFSLTTYLTHANIKLMSSLIKELNYYTHKIISEYKIPHFHTGYELIYAIGGTVNIEINDLSHEVVAPAIIMLNPFEWHKIRSADNNYLRYTLVVNSEHLEGEINPRIISTIKCRPYGFSNVIQLDLHTTSYVSEIFATLKNEFNNNYAFGEKIISNEICNLLILIHRLCNKTNKTYNESMMNIQLYIDENYKDIENIESIARKFFISPEYLSRAFKIYSGYTPIEYLLNTRLYQAQLLVTSSSMTATQICREVGFKDINNFTRQFRLKYGIPPMTFRKLHNNSAIAD